MIEDAAIGERIKANLTDIARGLWWRLVLDRMLGRFPLVAGLAMVPAVVLSFFPDRVSGGLVLAGWTALILVGLLAMAIPRLINPVTSLQAAAWLDQRLGSQELFSAVLVSLDRVPSGPFDQAVIDRTLAKLTELSETSFQLFPVRRLRFLAIRAGSITAVALLLLGLLPWLVQANQPVIMPSDELADIPNLAPKNSDPPLRELPPDALDEAKNLFPNDPRLADLAAQAIVDGDTKALEFLLGQAAGQGDSSTNDPNSRPDAGASAAPGQKPNDQRMGGQSGPGAERRTPSDQRNGPGQTKPGQSGDPGRGDDQSGRDRLSSGNTRGEQAGKGTRSDSNDQSDDGDLSGQGDKSGDESGDQSNKGGQLGGNLPGQGTATQQFQFSGRRIKPGPELLFNKNTKNGQLEMILGGKGVRATLSQVVPGARTGAISGFGQKPPPLQYEAYVRSYFRALSQEATQ